MVTPSHLLLLTGSGEGRALAETLAQRGEALRVTASQMRADHWSGPLPVPTRFGGFGGADGFRMFLRDERITAVLDATHPFAARISARSWDICRDLDIPFLQLDRPSWRAGAGDRWTEVASTAEAAQLIPPTARVFVTTGRAELAPLRRLDGPRYFVRRLSDDPVKDDVSSISYVYGNGPFSCAEEIETFTRLKVDLLLCKNSGGETSRSKLDAARQLGIPVLLLSRPPATGAPLVRNVPEALDWVAGTCR